MRRTSVCVGLLLGALVVGASPPLAAQVHRIEGGGSAAIRAAILRAAPGETLVLAPGVYSGETIIVDRPLSLAGEPGAVLDGDGKYEVLRVTADDVEVRGLVIRGAGLSHVRENAAIRVEGAHRCRIEENELRDNFFGIVLNGSQGCVVKSNRISARGVRETSSGNGIHVWNSRDVRLMRNSISGHRDGIYFEFVEDSKVVGNVGRDNLRYGLHFMFSSRCRYERNRFERNGAGVAVMYSAQVKMRDNLFAENRGPAAFGLLLKEMSDSTVRGNRFAGNSVGIYLEASNRVVIADNAIVENGWALKLMASSVGTQLLRNNFSGNAFDVSTNSRMPEVRLDGNFWDRYRGYDLDRDGVGDIPFRPVALFGWMVEQNPPMLLLVRSPLAMLINSVERVLPALTPEALSDPRPRMEAW